VAASLFLFALYISRRMKAAFTLETMEETDEKAAERAHEFLFDNRRLLRSTNDQHTHVAAAYGAWESMQNGLFRRWYHDFFTGYAMLFVLLIATYGLHAMGAIFTSPLGLALDFATYLAILNSVRQFGGAIKSLAMTGLNIYASTGSVRKIAKILNARSEEILKIRAARNPGTPYDDMDRNPAGLKEALKEASFWANEALCIENVTYAINPAHPSFQSLCMVDSDGDLLTHLPAGAFIGLREGDAVRGTHDAAIILASILSGHLIPQRGVCHPVAGRKVGLVSARQYLLSKSTAQTLAGRPKPAAYVSFVCFRMSRRQSTAPSGIT
jgi:ABC-type multidrug transport system fused ATPase/permease subunit